MIIQPMNTSDLDSILEIERTSFLHPWSRESFLSEMKNRNARNYIITKDPGKPLETAVLRSVYGYACFNVAADELHLLKMAIKQEMRQKKVATRLLQECLSQAASESLEYAFLEVRRTNETAIRLYEKLGFCLIAVRPAYYPEDSGKREDALIMRKILKGGNTWQ